MWIPTTSPINCLFKAFLQKSATLIRSWHTRQWSLSRTAVLASPYPKLLSHIRPRILVMEKVVGQMFDLQYRPIRPAQVYTLTGIVEQTRKEWINKSWAKLKLMEVFIGGGHKWKLVKKNTTITLANFFSFFSSYRARNFTSAVSLSTLCRIKSPIIDRRLVTVSMGMGSCCIL